jgi:hypothetical protein
MKSLYLFAKDTFVLFIRFDDSISKMDDFTLKTKLSDFFDQYDLSGFTVACQDGQVFVDDKYIILQSCFMRHFAIDRAELRELNATVPNHVNSCRGTSVKIMPITSIKSDDESFVYYV